MAEHGAADGPIQGFARLARIAGEVAAPTTLVVALMVYFGWARTSVLYATFGIRQGILELSVQDYLLGSVNETFKPLAVLLFAILVAVPGHAAMVRSLARRPRLTSPVCAALGSVGVVLAAIGLLGLSRLVIYRVSWPLIPMSLGLGVLLVGYGAALYTVVTGRRPAASAPTLRVITSVAFAGFLVLTLFWSVAVYAQLHGFAAARAIAERPTALPGAVVFAQQQLNLDGPGIRETSLPGDEARYRYRYDGLRLLVRANERYVLLPEQWRPGAHAVVLLDEPSLRVEFFRGPGGS
ncbi:MAG: hypothetical protein ACR2FQ_09895 [Pseudonocardiaceae bacterium]